MEGWSEREVGVKAGVFLRRRPSKRPWTFLRRGFPSLNTQVNPDEKRPRRSATQGASIWDTCDPPVPVPITDVTRPSQHFSAEFSSLPAQTALPAVRSGTCALKSTRELRLRRSTHPRLPPGLRPVSEPSMWRRDRPHAGSAGSAPLPWSTRPSFVTLPLGHPPPRLWAGGRGLTGK